MTTRFSDSGLSYSSNNREWGDPIQYIVRYSLPNAWSVGAGPSITINWEADGDDRVTFPVGLGVTKTVRRGNLPVKLRAEVHYSIIRPESRGEAWNFRFQVTPVIKSPFQ